MRLAVALHRLEASAAALGGEDLRNALGALRRPVVEREGGEVVPLRLVRAGGEVEAVPELGAVGGAVFKVPGDPFERLVGSPAREVALGDEDVEAPAEAGREVLPVPVEPEEGRQRLCVLVLFDEPFAGRDDARLRGPGADVGLARLGCEG
jgi:hypothetical protein